MHTEDDYQVRRLLEAIHIRYSYDFRRYAPSSVKRRLAQALPRFRCGSVAELQARILADPALMQELIGHLTVQVSEMFRDPDFYRALREKVIPYLRTYPSPKVWVAGCSTGEEVYSLAILLREEGLLHRSLIYATDISAQALQKAETGIYGLERIAAFSRAYQAAGGRSSLSDYYVAAYNGAVFDRSLRGNVLFTDHCLATDSVFAEVQLITCRNVLIYFDRALQDRAVALYRDALDRGGFLGLGSRETLAFSRHAADFTEFIPEQRIYRRR